MIASILRGFSLTVKHLERGDIGSTPVINIVDFSQILN